MPKLPFEYVDWTSQTLIEMSREHHEVHDGHSFQNHNKLTILTGQTAVLSFVTPATPYIHYSKSNVFSAVDKLSIDFYEGAVVNVAGTVVPSVNRNRNSSIATGVIIRQGDTYSNNGTKLEALCSYLAGSVDLGQRRAGSSGDSGEEIILKPNTVYRYLLTNGSTETNIVTVDFNWYEHL